MSDKVDPLVQPLLYVVLRTAKHFRLTERDLFEDIRLPHVVEARHAGFWLARNLFGKERVRLCDIGRAFRRDHATVINGISKAGLRMAQDPAYRAHVLRLRAALVTDLELADARRDAVLTRLLLEAGEHRGFGLASPDEKDQKERATETA